MQPVTVSQYKFVATFLFILIQVIGFSQTNDSLIVEKRDTVYEEEIVFIEWEGTPEKYNDLSIHCGSSFLSARPTEKIHSYNSTFSFSTQKNRLGFHLGVGMHAHYYTHTTPDTSKTYSHYYTFESVKTDSFIVHYPNGNQWEYIREIEATKHNDSLMIINYQNDKHSFKSVSLPFACNYRLINSFSILEISLGGSLSYNFKTNISDNKKLWGHSFQASLRYAYMLSPFIAITTQAGIQLSKYPFIQSDTYYKGATFKIGLFYILGRD